MIILLFLESYQNVYIFRIQEDHPVMSFTLNDKGRLALLNVATQVSHDQVLDSYFFQ